MRASLWVLCLLGCAADPGAKDRHAGGSTTDSATVADTDTPGSPGTGIPDSCTAPTALAPDPLTPVGTAEIEINTNKAHLVQVVPHPDGSLLYGVGYGGLYTFALAGGVPSYLGRRAVAADDVQHVALLASGALVLSSRDDGLELLIPSGPGPVDPAPQTFGRHRSGLLADGDRLYSAALDGRVEVLDMSALSFDVVGTVTGLQTPSRMALAGDRLYVGDQAGGIAIVDVSDPTAPALITWWAAPAAVHDVAVHEGTLYAALGTMGVASIDVSDPRAPVLLDTLAWGQPVLAVDGARDHVWVAGGRYVSVVDVSDPRALVGVSTETTDRFTMDVVAREDLDGAYTASWYEAGSYGLDASVPAPELDLEAPHAWVIDGVAEVRLGNRGSAPLSILGLTVTDPALEPDRAPLEIAPGDTAVLALRLADGVSQLDAQLCLATTDPDESRVQLPIGLSPEGSVHIGEPAPNFRLPDLDQQPHELAAQLGRPVLLAYFATW